MQQRDERAHGVVNDALAKGFLDTGAIYPVDGIASHDAANEARLSVNRAGQHLGMSTPCWVVDQDGQHCPKGCQRPDSPHGIRFRIHSKDSARKHVYRQTAGDPSKLRYNPFARAAGPVVDDYGRRLRP